MKFSPKVTAAFLIGCLLAGMLPTVSEAAVPVGVIVNGMKIRFTDTRPYIDSNHHTMVPVRLISEELGAEVKWQDPGQVDIELAGKRIELRIQDRTALIDGAELKMDTEAVLHSGSTMVPLRFVSEALGAKVVWDQEAHAIQITDAAFEADSPPLDAWGRLIRSDGLPANSKDWPYILADLPNSVYGITYRPSTQSDQPRLLPVETFSDPGLGREHLDQWAMRIKRYYDTALNVNYQEIDPSTWWERFVPDMNVSSMDTDTRVRYAEWVRQNRIRVEGWADPEPSMIYRQDGNKYVMRTWVRFRILESDADYGVILDTFDASYEVKLKQGVWYSGYADILLSTSTAGDPLPYYGVTTHDHLYFTPVAGIREEV